MFVRAALRRAASARRAGWSKAALAAAGAGAAGLSLAVTSPPAQAAPTIKGLLDQISDRLDRIETTLGIGPDYAAELAKIAEVKATQPDNIGIQCFDYKYFDSLSPDLKARMIACARSGFENPDSGMGAYAIQVSPRAPAPPRPPPVLLVRKPHKKHGAGSLLLTLRAKWIVPSPDILRHVRPAAGRLRRPDAVPGRLHPQVPQGARHPLRSAHSHADIPRSCARILAAPCFARRAELPFCFVSHHEDD